MAKTHHEVIEATDDKLLTLITKADLTTLRSIVHENVIYTNENGEIFKGFDKLQINDINVLCFKTIDVIERSITIFNNVAIVNSFKKKNRKIFGAFF